MAKSYGSDNCLLTSYPIINVKRSTQKYDLTRLFRSAISPFFFLEASLLLCLNARQYCYVIFKRHL